MSESRLRVCRFGSTPPASASVLGAEDGTSVMYANGVNIEPDHCLFVRDEQDGITLTPSPKPSNLSGRAAPRRAAPRTALLCSALM